MTRSALFNCSIHNGLKCLLPILFLFGFISLGHAQFRYNKTPALQIIDHIEQKTPFRFLYRDALLADVSLSFRANNQNLFNKFRAALRFHKLDLKVDSTRNQAIIYQLTQNGDSHNEITVQGYVVDATTGERLPFANITWTQGSRITGISAGKSGSFHFSRIFDKDTVTFQGSYIGYASQKVMIDITKTENITELTFRLKPERIDVNEVIITDSKGYGSLQQQANALVNIGTFSPLGATNSMRALQALPSVSASPAMSAGLHVRGSPADGFQLLLDEVPIYNQTHLFGLLDSFNADILQRNSFFYDIAPAQFPAPPGGTLSLDTRSGSLNKLSGTAGINNSSVRLTLGGPIQKGKSSWIISGRKSYMNTVNWLNNADLISWGLNVDRDKDVLSDNLSDFESQLVRVNETDASFFDLHAKVYMESNEGNRLLFNGYAGGDNTRQSAQRLFESFSMSNKQHFDRRPVSTSNDWHNGAGSVQYEQWFGSDWYSKSTLGGSFYQTSFSKDDFSYTEINRTTRSLQNFIYPFTNKSVLNEVKADQLLEFYAEPWILSAGLSYHFYSGEYYEDSFDYPGYFNSQKTHQIDGYAQANFSKWNILDVFAGVRLHYYSAGKYLRWSPRIKLKLFPNAKVSAGAGFSRNHQFLNQVNLPNTVTADVWVLAGPNQQPTEVNYYSTGLYFDLWDHLYAQAEAYSKEFENLWLHQLNTYSLANSFHNNPWLTDNSGRARGLEFLLRTEFHFLELNQTFTLSEMVLSNPAINKGQSFYADWDRRYQYNATLAVRPVDNLSLNLSWMFASGTPNKLSVFGTQNNQRLDPYRRADISAEYNRDFGTTTVQFTATVFNVLDRQNPWYRELTYVINQSSTPNSFKSVPVDVYDIGLQPSFNVSVNF